MLIFNYKSSPKALHPLNLPHTNFWLAAVYPDSPTLDYNIAYPSYFQRSMSYTAVCSFCCVACIYLFNHHPGIGSLTHCIRAGQYVLGATYMYICNCSQTDVSTLGTHCLADAYQSICFYCTSFEEYFFTQKTL